ncbi:MAG: acetyltransferase [Clostridia bacterium]|nr:acetyltransferase [Clostridia bacterium]
MNEKVIIIGAGGHAKVVADTVRKNGDEVIGFLDDKCDKRGEGFCHSTILGAVSEYGRFADEASFIVAVGDGLARKRISETVNAKWYTAIHPSAIIADGVKIGEGSFVSAGAIVNPDTEVGKHTIINTGSIVEHDCKIGDFTHIAPSATVCGGTSVGELCWIGAGATVINGITVCNGVTVGAGATVVKNVTERGIYVGVPAGKLEK